jgi:predicted site-specific integrase-resolvase
MKKSPVKAPIKTSQLLNLTKASEELGVAVVTMRRYIAAKKIRTITIGKLTRITRAEIEKVKTYGFRVPKVKKEVVTSE